MKPIFYCIYIVEIQIHLHLRVVFFFHAISIYAIWKYIVDIEPTLSNKSWNLNKI